MDPYDTFLKPYCGAHIEIIQTVQDYSHPLWCYILKFEFKRSWANHTLESYGGKAPQIFKNLRKSPANFFFFLPYIPNYGGMGPQVLWRGGYWVREVDLL